jgi:hypothetical protein
MRKERRGRRGGQRWLAEEKNEGTKEKKRKKKIVFFCPSLHPPCAVNMRMWTMQTRWSHVRKTYAYPWQSLAPLSTPTPSFSLYPFSFPCLIARACLCKCIVVVQLLTYSSDQFFFPYLILTHHSLILSLSLPHVLLSQTQNDNSACANMLWDRPVSCIHNIFFNFDKNAFKREFLFTCEIWDSNNKNGVLIVFVLKTDNSHNPEKSKFELSFLGDLNDS